MKYRKYYSMAAVGLLLMIAAFTGCGRPKPDGFPEIYPCTVKIIQAGQPVEGAVVAFFLTDKTVKSWSVNGVTGKNGTAQMISEGFFKGVPAGHYNVSVQKRFVDDSHTAKSAQEYNEMQERGEESYTVTTVSIDPAYGNPTLSGLEIEVAPSGANEATFDLGEAYEEVFEEESKPMM